MATTAEKENGHYINGSKLFITHEASEKLLLLRQLQNKEDKKNGISAFILEKGWKGFKTGKKETNSE